MALWYPTADLTVATAKVLVAKTIGASDDSTMLDNAVTALKTALFHWDNHRDWRYSLWQEQIVWDAESPDHVVATDYKKTYSLRSESPVPRVLQYIPLREYDSLRPDQTAYGTPHGYHITYVWRNTGSGQAPNDPGFIRLVPTPDVQTTCLHVYYRRHLWDDTTIDIPLRFQYDLVALAKMYFLADRGDEANLAFWTQQAMAGIKRAEAEDEWAPNDAQPGFVPGSHYARQGYAPNDVLPFLGEW